MMIGAGNRTRMQQMQQKQWCEEQMAEKSVRDASEKAGDVIYVEMNAAHDKLLKEAQEAHDGARRTNEADAQSVNRMLAADALARTAAIKEAEKAADDKENEYIKNSDFLNENQATEVSMLAPHRVKPYHFKGMTQAQQNAILHERSIQLREKELQKQQAIDEERQYAIQMEHQRRQQILEDRKQKKAHRGVMHGYMLDQTAQAAEQKAKWVDPYAEKFLDS